MKHRWAAKTQMLHLCFRSICVLELRFRRRLSLSDTHFPKYFLFAQVETGEAEDFRDVFEKMDRRGRGNIGERDFERAMGKMARIRN